MFKCWLFLGVIIGVKQKTCMFMENYGRFWAAFNRLPHRDRESDKDVLVRSFTQGRTGSLREMTSVEYARLCESLESVSGWKDELRKKRSVCLSLMQRAGVDTTDWCRVNSFCENPRIAGRVFAHLGLKELDALQVKLRAIISKGGLRKSPLQLPRGGGKRGTESQTITEDEGWVPIGIVGLMGEC